MRRRRKRKKLNIRPILWILLVLNIAVGLFYSPITAVARVSVVGVPPGDQARVEGVLQSIVGIPCIRVNAAAVEEAIMKRPDVIKATLGRNIFGNGKLTVTYSPPVALVQGTKNLVLTQSGVMCVIPHPPANLPSLQLFAGATNSFVGLCSNWEMAQVAEVCKRAENSGLVKDLSITVNLGGSVCLNSGATGRVVLGNPDGLDEKFDKLREVLAVQPDLLSQGRQLNLVAASKPVTSPLEGK